MMNSLVIFVQKSCDVLGINRDTFYSMLITFLPVVGQLVKSVWSKIKRRREQNVLDLYRKRENDNFYVIVMVVEVAVVAVGMVVTTFIEVWVIQLVSLINLQINLHYELIYMISGSIGTVLIIEKMNWGRKRLLGDKEGKIIVYCSAVLINMAAALTKLEGNIRVVGVVLMCLYLINEIVGLIHFQGRYIKYDFSSLALYLNNDDKIICENIEKVNKKGNYVFVENHDRNIVLKYDQICRIEYYGAPKFILNEGYEKRMAQFVKKIWKRFKDCIQR